MRTALAAVLSAALLLGGCGWTDSPAGGGGGSEAGLAWHECSDQVAITITTRHRCGTLTVPVDPEASSGPSLRLDVVEVWPADAEDATDVAVSAGFNFGELAHDPGSLAALAERFGVAVVALAPRGVGEPGGTALDCPELDGYGATQVGEPDAAGREAFLAAVRSCRERLSGAGVDPAGFGVDDLVADLEALRVAMDVDRWHALVTYGEIARLSDAYAASYGDRVRAIVKDSPPPPGRDSFALAAEGTRSALAALFAECRDDRRCSSRYPDLEGSWAQALERVAARPLTGTSDGGDVVVDAPKFLRAVRAMLGGDGPVYVADLPRVITTAADGAIHPTLVSVVAADPGYCNGYRPLCTKPGFSMGAYLSQACPELGTDNGPGEDDPLYRQVFTESPYVDACAVWDVAPSAPPVAPADVPTLVLNGDLDAWSRPEWFDASVVVRGATHDVAGSSPCVFDIRNPWVADPQSEVRDAPCDAAPYPVWD